MTNRLIREVVLHYTVGGYDEAVSPPVLAQDFVKQVQDALAALPEDRRSTARVDFDHECSECSGSAWLTVYYDRLETAEERTAREKDERDAQIKWKLHQEYSERVMLAQLLQKYGRADIFSPENGRT